MEPGGVAELAELIAGRRWVALTGAGMSTDSGIPDYRGPTSPPANPMLYADFVRSADNRRRYWARSFRGWPRMLRARPNAGHVALASLAATGLAGVLTQNVDGLHTAAGSPDVIDLHGRLAEVICLACGEVSDRADLQVRLAAANPDAAGFDIAPGQAELRPDGDLEVDDHRSFVVPDCETCGGVLKPHVVFFGESVPRERVTRAYALVDGAEVLVVLGSSLAVMSGLRFPRHLVRTGRSVAIVNRGATRGDELATVRLAAGTSETLGGLAAALSAPA